MQMCSIPKYSRRLLTWVVVLALVLRSLIPAGFMPDFSGQAHGVFALTICDGVHHQHHSDGGTTHDHSEVCPFSMGAIYGYAGIQTPVVITPVFTITASMGYASLLLTPYIIFSNASPRSPPSFS